MPKCEKSFSVHESTAARRLTIQIENSTVEQAFVKVLRSAGVPGGIVLSSQCCRIAHNFEIKDMSLPQALDLITSYDASYTWDFDHGAIYLHPRQMPPVLETKIAEFKGSGSLENLKTQLFALAEVRTAVENLRLHPARLMGGIYNPRPQQLSMDLHNTTLYEALNSLVARHGTAIWQYGEDTGSGEFNLIFLVR